MDILRKLFTPLRYSRIEHKQKTYVDLYIPAILAIIVCIAYIFLPVQFTIIGKEGIIKSLSAFLQVVSGFYIAALGAIATFPNKNMDVLMDGIPLQLDNHPLTRRQFLSYMFGYLAFIGFFLVLLGIFTEAISPNIIHLKNSINLQVFITLKLIFIYIYFFLFCKMLLTTLYGLYYLTEKIHEIKSEFSGEIGSASTEDKKQNEDTDF
jgi:hypothetical protein